MSTTTQTTTTVIVECILCQGAGERTIEETCSCCEGKGEVMGYSWPDDSYRYPVWNWEPCEACNTMGWQSTTRQCGHCEGEGFVEHTHEVTA